MKELKVKEILQATGGRLLAGAEEKTVSRVSTDSREVIEGDLFFAIKGNRFDGHDFLNQAAEKGCRAMILSESEKVPPAFLKSGGGYNLILVEDTVRALQLLAKYYIGKLHLKKKIAVTGSVGKTSTRDMLYYIASEKYRTGRNLKNYNNELGLPLTILSFDEDLEVAVLEMGMDNFGEIHTLADIVRPDIGVITNIGISHIENLGSREGILRAKMEITDYFDKDSVLIVNQSCDLLSRKNTEGAYRLVTAGFDGKNDYIISNVCDFGDKGIKYTLDRNHKQYEVNLPIPGAHNAVNATLAIAACAELDISVPEAIEGLRKTELTAKRLNIKGKNGIKVIDDTYNACPESVRSAINTLMATKGLRKVAVLGDMFELGSDSRIFHEEVGRYAGEKKIDFLITIGGDSAFMAKGALENMDPQQVRHFEKKEDFLEKINEYIFPGDVVLVKASRGMEMESIVKKIFEDKE